VQKKWSTSEKSFFWPKLPFLSSRCGTLAQNEFDLSNRIMECRAKSYFYLIVVIQKSVADFCLQAIFGKRRFIFLAKAPEAE